MSKNSRFFVAAGIARSACLRRKDSPARSHHFPRRALPMVIPT